MTVSGLHFAGAPRAGDTLSVGGSGTATAHLREIAFVDSTRPPLAIDAQPRGRFTRVALDSLRFADTGQPAVQIGATVELTLVDVQGDHPDEPLRADSAAIRATCGPDHPRSSTSLRKPRRAHRLSQRPSTGMERET